MTYNIRGVFPTTDDANSAAHQLMVAGFIKQFEGFTKNSKFQPESLVEDHFIDENEISVYTPNLNRAHKAKNILIKFGGDLNKITGIYFEKVKKETHSFNTESQLKKRKKLKDQKSKLREGRIDTSKN